MWHGMFLLLIGMLTGLVEPSFTNVRMGLAAHLEGLTNGILLLAVGAAWTEVRLALRTKTIAYWTALYGTYVNWLFTTVAAVLGTASLSPVLGAGYGAPSWQERLVTAGFLSAILSIFTTTILILLGLRSRASERYSPDQQTLRAEIRG
jgi:hydroxylaminobenzene mutase